MLFGEHAVLNGSMAIACALDKYITVTLTPRTDNKIVINSELLGKYETAIKEIKIEHPFQFVLSAITLYINKIKMGFDLSINADFSDKEGLGSSAAVTVATISVLEKY
jgi:mevalonate kinase